ncbi:MAG: glutathione S-transferase family protein [Acidobacteria bacterium]|nr:glutathione S-transferase family protein [Acidobacteriota bacterium]MCB9399469.1 glutathione S-transferase family protein [Acidobacteriota bacterium]
MKLYGFNGAASLAPHLVLEELGLAYEWVALDSSRGDHKQADYLALNPLGRVPTLVDGDLVLTESAAICLHACDRYGNGRLLPALGTPERAHLYQWMMFLTNTLQPAFLNFFYPERCLPDGMDASPVVEKAKAVLAGHFQYLNQYLQGRDCMVGDNLSAADFFAFMLIRWGRHLEPPAVHLTHLGRLVERISALDSVKRVMAQEQIPYPFALKPGA